MNDENLYGTPWHAMKEDSEVLTDQGTTVCVECPPEFIGLVSSAPDLLKALQDLVKKADDFFAAHNIDAPEAKQMVDEGHAAIAKALL